MESDFIDRYRILYEVRATISFPLKRLSHHVLFIDKQPCFLFLLNVPMAAYANYTNRWGGIVIRGVGETSDSLSLNRGTWITCLSIVMMAADRS